MTQDLIIEKPALQSRAQRFGWGLVTFIFWAIYIYLWLPLITLVAWWVGYKLFKIQIIDLHGYTGLRQQMALYLSVIFIISLTLIGWAIIERQRFKHALRRHSRSPVTITEMANHYQLDESELNTYRKKKSVIVHFAEDGKITKVTDYEPLPKDIATSA